MHKDKKMYPPDHRGIAPLRVMSLAQVAEIMNSSGRYERPMTPAEVSRIERGAMKKLSVLMCEIRMN